jgi:hypothetical protein
LVIESACTERLMADVVIARNKNFFADLMQCLKFVGLCAGIYRFLLLSLNRFLAKTLFNDNAIQ